MDDQNKASENAALIAAMEKFHKPQTIKVKHGDLEATLLAVPGAGGVEIHGIKSHLDVYRDAPERKTGTSRAHDLASFIALVNRFKDATSALFCWPDPKQPSMQAVLDYHHPSAPEHDVDFGARFCSHRVAYDFPLSDQWQKWMAGNGEPMEQGEFAAFIEDRIGDVVSFVEEREAGAPRPAGVPEVLGSHYASPSMLVTLSRGLEVHAAHQVKQTVVLQTGEVKMTFEEQHQDAMGGPVHVPNLFMIAIPVFQLDALYQIAVRLRYRLGRGSIKWFYELYRTDIVFDHAVREAATRAEQVTELPLYYGKPEHS